MAILDINGFKADNLDNILVNLQQEYSAIFGVLPDISSNTPEGNYLNIIAKKIKDLQDLLQSVISSFDPEQAVGTQLDARCSINGVARKLGGYTQQYVEITTTANIVLNGEDTSSDPFIVSDGNNNFILQTTSNLSIGVNNLLFRAEKQGAITTTQNTITKMITVVGGISKINNNSNQLSIGSEEETDAELRIRRRKSVAKKSQSYLDSIGSNLEDVDGVVDVKLYSNDTGIKNEELNLEPFTLWAIVDGGTNTDIADVIYKHKSCGSPMKGNVSYNILTRYGDNYVVKFDRPIQQEFYLKTTIKLTSALVGFNNNVVAEYIANNYKAKIGESFGVGDATDLIQAALLKYNVSAKITNCQLSIDNQNWLQSIDTSTAQHKFTISQSNIFISNS